jgi:hypothetical protein
MRSRLASWRTRPPSAMTTRRIRSRPRPAPRSWPARRRRTGSMIGRVRCSRGLLLGERKAWVPPEARVLCRYRDRRAWPQAPLPNAGAVGDTGLDRRPRGVGRHPLRCRRRRSGRRRPRVRRSAGRAEHRGTDHAGRHPGHRLRRLPGGHEPRRDGSCRRRPAAGGRPDLDSHACLRARLRRGDRADHDRGGRDPRPGCLRSLSTYRLASGLAE